MIFTDCDLKRFKLWTYDYFATDKFYCRTYEIIALLSRLEAAEEIVNRPCANECGNCYCKTNREVWQKSKGE